MLYFNYQVFNSLKQELVKNDAVEKFEINKEEFILYLSLFVDQVKSPIFADQMCQYLMNVLQVNDFLSN
jgi:hypothetical protein